MRFWEAEVLLLFDVEKWKSVMVLGLLCQIWAFPGEMSRLLVDVLFGFDLVLRRCVVDRDGIMNELAA
jgi:hypothetical protein